MTPWVETILLVTKFNKTPKLSAFSFIEVLVSMVIVATLFVVTPWFGFFDSLRKAPSDIAAETQHLLREALLQQAATPRFAILEIYLPVPCEDVRLSILAGGVVVADQFECREHIFDVLPSGKVQYVAQN